MDSFYNVVPEDVWLKIFSYLPFRDSCCAALTCKKWLQVFLSPYNWKRKHLKIYCKSDIRWLKCIKFYSQDIRNLVIELDQFELINRITAVGIINHFSSLNTNNLQCLTIICNGKNPFFYSGTEFVEAITNLFNSPQKSGKSSSVKYINLKKFPMLFDDNLINNISKNLQMLAYLNIHNDILICKVTPSSIYQLIKHCKHLKELHIYMCSLSKEVLLALTDSNRCSLNHLSLKCRSEEKYNELHSSEEQITSEVWSKVVEHLPNLTVALHFDPSFPYEMLQAVLKPEIPCSILHLETFTMLHQEVYMAAKFYKNTLRKVILQTCPSKELNEAILELSKQCHKLYSLHVFCILNSDTIDEILCGHPLMVKLGTYTLRTHRGNGPWATDELLNM